MKKENQRSEALGHRLEDLYRRGADEAFLDLVHERCRNLPELPAAGCHGEVVDRALRRALMSRDWHQAGRVLKRLRRDVAGGRPMVRLAEAALHLVEGRLDEARAGLAALAQGSTEGSNGASPVPACLVTALEALAVPDVPGQGGSSQYVWELARRLELLREQGFRVTPQDVRSFEVILGALEVGVAGDVAAGKLLSAARERLRLLETLDALERDLRRDLEGGMDRILGPFLEQAVEWWAALTRVLPATLPWNLVRPFHHALRLSWRRLLQMLADNEGPGAWATLTTMTPAFIDLELENGAGAKNSGSEAGRLWREWSDHFYLRRFRSLAEFLEAKSRSEKDPARLADLWDAELMAWQWAARSIPRGGHLAVTPVRTVMDRLTRMAKETGQRLPPGQRPAMARRLRDHLLCLLEVEPLGSRTFAAAVAFLAHLDGDPVLPGAVLDPRDRLLSLLEREPRLEDALMIYRMLDQELTWKPELLPALSRARVAVIDRLDRRFDLWRGYLLDFYDEATPEEVHRLKERLCHLLDREAGNPEGSAVVSERLANALRQIDLWQERDQKLQDEEEEDGWDDDDWEDDEEDDDEDTREYPLPDISSETLERVLARLFPPPCLVMKPLEPAPGPLQPQDLQPLLRPMRQQAVEEALRAGLREDRS